MARSAPLPFQLQLSEADYLELLKMAPRQSRLLTRLIAAVEDERKRAYLFTGFFTDGLALRAVALIHAPKAVPAIERALKKRAREG